MQSPRPFLIAACLVMAASATASAQQKFQTLGPNECINCHDHEKERQWYEKQEIPEVRKLFPDKGANAGHINSLKQMEAPKSNEFAKAIGLADKYDTNGACVKCHATVFAGDANAGVSCESCHGPASGYLKPHQTKDAYDQSVAQFGMTKLVGNIQAWTQQCTSCHVMDNQKLIDAGHPPGDDFDLGKRYVPVSLHFKKKYSATDVSAIGRPETEAIVRKRRGGAAPAATVAPPPPVMPPNVATSSAAVPVPAPASAPAPAPAAPISRSPAAAAPPASAVVLAPVAPAAPPTLTPVTDAPAITVAPGPVVVQTPAAATPAPAVTMPVAVTVSAGGITGFLQQNGLWVGLFAVVAAIAIVVWGRKSSAGK
jgi:Cytochrome c554 and c-prime